MEEQAASRLLCFVLLSSHPHPETSGLLLLHSSSSRAVLLYVDLYFGGRGLFLTVCLSGLEAVPRHYPDVVTWKEIKHLVTLSEPAHLPKLP